MPRVEEAYDSGKLTASQENGAAELRYYVFQTEDYLTALAALIQHVPEFFLLPTGTIYLQNARITDRCAPDQWEGLASYGPQKPPDQGVIKIRFRSSGATAKIKQALQQWKYGPSQTVPDHKGAIEARKEGVEGTDIIVPLLEWEETHPLPPKKFGMKLVNQLSVLTGSTNKSVFRGFPAGEVLYKGIDGSGDNSGKPFDLTFAFAQSRNLKDIHVDSWKVDRKGGWEYIEFHYDPAESADALVQKPTSAYVSRVYEASEFSLLGIGTGMI